MELSQHNQCGRLIRYDDTAGSLLLADYSLLGEPITQERRFSLTPETNNWPAAIDERDALLEADSAITQWQKSALGEALIQIDARQNRQRKR